MDGKWERCMQTASCSESPLCIFGGRGANRERGGGGGSPARSWPRKAGSQPAGWAYSPQSQPGQHTLSSTALPPIVSASAPSFPLLADHTIMNKVRLTQHAALHVSLPHPTTALQSSTKDTIPRADLRWARGSTPWASPASFASRSARLLSAAPWWCPPP